MGLVFLAVTGLDEFLDYVVARVGEVKTFDNFIVPLPDAIEPSRYNTVIVWCETFSQFITAAKYR